MFLRSRLDICRFCQDATEFRALQFADAEAEADDLAMQYRFRPQSGDYDSA